METNKEIIADFVKLYNRENKVFYGEGKERYLAPPIERWINGMINDGRKDERSKITEIVRMMDIPTDAWVKRKDIIKRIKQMEL